MRARTERPRRQPSTRRTALPRRCRFTPARRQAQGPLPQSGSARALASHSTRAAPSRGGSIAAEAAPTGGCLMETVCRHFHCRRLRASYFIAALIVDRFAGANSAAAPIVSSLVGATPAASHRRLTGGSGFSRDISLVSLHLQPQAHQSCRSGNSPRNSASVRLRQRPVFSSPSFMLTMRTRRSWVTR